MLCPCGYGEIARIGDDTFKRVIPAQFQVLVNAAPEIRLSRLLACRGASPCP